MKRTAENILGHKNASHSFNPVNWWKSVICYLLLEKHCDRTCRESKAYHMCWESIDDGKILFWRLLVYIGVDTEHEWENEQSNMVDKLRHQWNSSETDFIAVHWCNCGERLRGMCGCIFGPFHSYNLHLVRVYMAGYVQGLAITNL